MKLEGELWRPVIIAALATVFLVSSRIVELFSSFFSHAFTLVMKRNLLHSQETVTVTAECCNVATAMTGTVPRV